MRPTDIKQLEQALEKSRTREETELLLTRVQQEISNKPKDPNLLHLRARIYTKSQRFSLAINDYRRILELNPDDTAAGQHLEQLQTILKYSANDIYANPNTNLDPWLE